MQVCLEGWTIGLEVVPPGSHISLQDSDGDAVSAFLDLEALGDVVKIRTRIPGDRFQPLGMSGTKKLQDFFTDAKVPRQQRDSIPLLVCERGIAWVVGHRVAQWAAPVEAAPKLKVTFLPE